MIAQDIDKGQCFSKASGNTPVSVFIRTQARLNMVPHAGHLSSREAKVEGWRVSV